MKVGIVTVYDSANFGAVLQAYAMQTTLKRMGHEVYFLRHRDENARKKVFFKHGNGLKQKIRYIQKYSFLCDKYRKMKDDIQYFDIVDDTVETNLQLDAILIGSDELWNVNVPYFQDTFFYGNNFKKDNKYVYAVSMGQASANDFADKQDIVEAMKKVKFIGVRDNNTIKAINVLTGNEVERVCDPTCLCKIEDFEKNSSFMLKEKYILIYAYTLSKDTQNYIQKYARKNNLKMVAVCMPHSWCDLNINCSSFDFIQVIKQAECVVTSTFHGTIFTFFNHKKCCILANSKKVSDFVKWMKMENNSLTDETITYEEFEKKITAEIDYATYEKTLDLYRQQSLKRLAEYF